uniref:AlNc14C222G9137 protein n=1 Tax=Albugo laibachii Nc14 TaxID=890382 RepID=F0WRZ5_9STRA|nr:AlNc14C222G9137 [Albugo laibachii Nc14]|eukprot:CCA24112.1 AlNc14C222G9137 [Albugo laibachii Nc14]
MIVVLEDDSLAKQKCRSEGREDGIQCVKGYTASDGSYLGLWNHITPQSNW